MRKRKKIESTFNVLLKVFHSIADDD